MIKHFSTSAALQDYVLAQADPDTLVVVPHRRLAHQLWDRQRLRESRRGSRAWEPIALTTLEDWWRELAGRLWLPLMPLSILGRVALWRQAMAASPDLSGIDDELHWAVALDEAQEILRRHQLPISAPNPTDPPLVTWRRQVGEIYSTLVQEKQALSPAQLPDYLWPALKAGKIKLPARIIVVGLETPAPVEAAWLAELSAVTEVSHLQVKGDLAAVRQAVALPDIQQEMAWTAAQVLEAARRDNLPLHRLAVTSVQMDRYASPLARVWRELLGPAGNAGEWAYNFSQGPLLYETPLYSGALLPLQFWGRREKREDLISLLFSPYYSYFQEQLEILAPWDRLWREARVEQGWDRLRETVSRNRQTGEVKAVGERLDHIANLGRIANTTGRDWIQRLRQTWSLLGFPGELESMAPGQYKLLDGCLTELEEACGAATLSCGEFIDWLNFAARQARAPGPGVQNAGVQVLGLLEMRGLDFDRVFCLGLSAASLPPPPRPLLLLSPLERQQVLGGTYQSQQFFAGGLWANLLGTAPQVTITFPRQDNDEEQLGTYFWPEVWEEDRLNPLSQPHPAWLTAPAIQAAFGEARPPAAAVGEEPPVVISLPDQVHITQMQTALSCPCRYLLENLLALRPLPEIAAGLTPPERGARLHKVLERFVRGFQQVLSRQAHWDQEQAHGLLVEAVTFQLRNFAADLHWQAERQRWLGEEDEVPGLLWEWLRLEQERFHQGWRWQGVEVVFKDLGRPDWAFTLQGRIDRVDHHAEAGLMVWDYKTGEVPKAKKVFRDEQEFQLPGYLLAINQGLLPLPSPVGDVRAGFIGLKSIRREHLKHEDFNSTPSDWQRLVAVWAEKVADVSRLLLSGEFTPRPVPSPEGKELGACQYCPYPLICGYQAESESGEEDM